MQSLVKFLQGKKTYLSAFVVAMAALCGWWYGVLDNTQAIAILGTASGLAGLSAKNERYGQMILTAMDDVRQAQQRSAAGQKVDVAQLAVEIGKRVGAQLVPIGGFNSVAVGPTSVGPVTVGTNSGSSGDPAK